MICSVYGYAVWLSVFRWTSMKRGMLDNFCIILRRLLLNRSELWQYHGMGDCLTALEKHCWGITISFFPFKQPPEQNEKTLMELALYYPGLGHKKTHWVTQGKEKTLDFSSVEQSKIIGCLQWNTGGHFIFLNIINKTADSLSQRCVHCLRVVIDHSRGMWFFFWIGKYGQEYWGKEILLVYAVCVLGITNSKSVLLLAQLWLVFIKLTIHWVYGSIAC